MANQEKLMASKSKTAFSYIFSVAYCLYIQNDFIF